MSWTLCIDFGTAYSKAAAAPSDSWANFDPAQVRPLMLGGSTGNAFLLDSAVFLEEDRILFGQAAVQRADLLAEKNRMALRSFKTILSVSDLDRALNTAAPRSIDPHGVFQMRDLIVLYLAYLSAAIERAIAADPVLSKAGDFERRYATPAWRGGDSAGNHNVVVRLFAEADAVRGFLGASLVAEQGVKIAPLRKALTLAAKTTTEPAMGLIFEATAAAAYTSIGLDNAASHLIVLDMGAGTTDVAAVVRSSAGLEELPEARVTLKQAGDFVDRVIANMALAQSPNLKTSAQQAELWRALMRSMRDIKESIFIDGRAMIRVEGRPLAFTLRDMMRERDFKDFAANLEQAYDHGLEVVRDAAIADKSREIQAVAVGGGAYAPFIQDLVRRKPPRAGKLRITPRPATPTWAHAPEFGGNLAPVFPQLAIAIGGALAPRSMLAAQAPTRPAIVRSDTSAAHD